MYSILARVSNVWQLKSVPPSPSLHLCVSSLHVVPLYSCCRQLILSLLKHKSPWSWPNINVPSRDEPGPWAACLLSLAPVFLFRTSILSLLLPVFCLSSSLVFSHNSSRNSALCPQNMINFIVQLFCPKLVSLLPSSSAPTDLAHARKPPFELGNLKQKW